MENFTQEAYSLTSFTECILLTSLANLNESYKEKMIIFKCIEFLKFKLLIA